MKDTYEISVAGLKRDLPLCRLNDTTKIAGFVIFGDVELTCACAKAMLEAAPDYDYIVSPEAKSIPLIHEMARQSGRNEYVLLRKAPKLYMKDILETDVKSITTEGVQRLYMDGKDAEKIRGKRVLLVDDVISTGGSVASAEALIKQAGGNIVAKMAILAEGDAANRKDIICLGKLPVFDSEGNVIG